MPKMNQNETAADLMAERAAKLDEAREIISRAKKDERKLTNTEEAALDRLQLEIREASVAILEKEVENRQAATAANNKEAKPKKISLRKMINEVVNGGGFSEESKTLIEQGRSIFQRSGLNVSSSDRAIDLPLITRTAQTVGVAANGGNTVEDERQGILLPLMDDLVLDALGVTRASGLVGDVIFPSVGSIEANWTGETTAATEVNATFAADKKFTPKRLTAKVTISNQLLIQSSEDVEGILRNMIVEAVQQKLQSTIFGSAAATGTKPGGLFATLPTDSGDISFERVIGLRTELATKNALRGNPKFLLNPILDGKCRTTLKDSVAGAEYLLSDSNKMAGFDVVSTNAIPTGLQTAGDESALAFGNWADYFVGSWGAIRLTVDTVSKADQDSIVLVINSYWDAGKLRDDSIVTATAK